MKFCIKCGNSLADDTVRCELCGEPQPTDDNSRTAENVPDLNTQKYNSDTSANPQPSYYNQRNYAVSDSNAKPTDSFCICGFVLGIISFFLPIIGALTGIIGVIFSILGVKKTKSGSENGFGFGIAGIILNSVALLFTLLLILITVIMYAYAVRY